MGVPTPVPDGQPLRQILRRSTEPAHRALDRSLGSLDLTDLPSYAKFLRVQLAARRPIEAWLSRHSPHFLLPPPQCHLIALDLAELGADQPPLTDDAFEAPVRGAIGVAWAMGGSSLGNRMMLGRIRRSSSIVPAAFLADAAMPEFFTRLRIDIDRPAADHGLASDAVEAASAVFALFARTAVRLAPPLEQAA